MAGQPYHDDVSRRPWGSGAIYPVKRGWRVALNSGSDPFGKRIRQEWQFADEAAARRFLEQVQNRLRRGLPAEESKVTVGAYALEWLDSRETAGPATIAMYRHLIANQLTEIADVRVAHLGAADVRHLIGSLRRAGYAPRTIRGAVDVLRMVLRMAMADGIVDRNVAELVERPQLDQAEPLHFTAEQARKFLAAAKISDPDDWPIYVVALGTGLRRGELLALTWRDVSLKARTITVRQAKTKAGERTIAMSSTVYDVFRAIRPRRPGPIWRRDATRLTRRVGLICEAANLPKLTFHGLRHSAASIMLAEGVHPLVIQQTLGHSRVAMTGHYAHAELGQQREGMERLAAAMRENKA